MDLANTLTFLWSPGLNGRLPLGSAASPNMYTDAIATDGADQIALLVVTTPAGGGTNANIFVRIAWAGQVPATNAPAVFIEECIESPGTLTGGVQRYSLNIKEYGPIPTAPSTRATIWVPTAVHYFKIGCYGDAAPTGNAAVTIFVERARTGSPVQQGR